MHVDAYYFNIRCATFFFFFHFIQTFCESDEVSILNFKSLIKLASSERTFNSEKVRTWKCSV
jgi:hypothetical protein